MLPLFEDAESLAQTIQGVTDRTTSDHREGWIAQEPHFTDRMLGGIAEAIRGFEGRGARWRARTLTDRGPGSEESRVGADFMGVFEATVSGVAFAKGFLSQAKLLEPSAILSTGEHNRLRAQCRRMLERTPDAFVFLYGSTGVRVVSGLAVLGSDHRVLDDLGTKTVREFFCDHFKCFIGDPTLTAPDHVLTLRSDGRLLLRADWVPRMIRIEAVGQ